MPTNQPCRARRRRRVPLVTAVCLGATLLPAVGHAQVANSTTQLSPGGARQNPTPGPTGGDTTVTGEDAGFFTGFWRRSNMLGDMGGVRTSLGNYGITIGATETSEVFGNATGGIRHAVAYDGLTLLSLGVDTQKAFGWDGGTFNVSALQIHGRNLSAENLGTLQTASGIEASRATRLWELWYQQSFLDGAMDVKVGQQSLDQEFYGSAGSSLFINTMMGWPLIPSVNLYAGGPAYPLSSLGVRVRAQPARNLTILGGVFDDNPIGGPFDDDAQTRGAGQSGTRFNLRTGALVFGEVQYAINQPANGDMDRGEPASGLPGVYKLGFYWDSAKFADQRFDDTGLSLADPNSSGVAVNRRHNFSIYGVADQMVWRPDPGEARAVSVFARVMGAPGDRNLVNFSVNGGVTLKAPLPGRDDDTFGIGFGVGKVSSRASELDKDFATFGSPVGQRSVETFLEITYQYSVTPWLQLQPDFQYVWMPGGGVPNPNDSSKRIGNEAVFGVRTNVTF